MAIDSEAAHRIMRRGVDSHRRRIVSGLPKKAMGKLDRHALAALYPVTG